VKVAFISGTSISNSKIFNSWEERRIETRYGSVFIRERDGFSILNRHGEEGKTPPHAIDHRANIQALSDLGYRDLISVNSVGSLREDLPPGSLVSCSDYVSFRPATFRDDCGIYEAPSVANHLIPTIVEKCGFSIETDAVYVQTAGPRFETKAEVRIIREWGDVVGMTFASEADLAREAGLRCNSLCIVDNFANGIAGRAISGEAFHALVAENQAKSDLLFERMLALFR